ncbi:zinc finger protein 250-like [Parambassis ranga]|uniref:Zinc finger protein 250-like n=1 Tax=Parambassis ranga TaxID=210632 RepID=A0A6P7K9N9_9TELE|nr:zinc finger protein 250-like [Parambassis ranga]
MEQGKRSALFDYVSVSPPVKQSVSKTGANTVNEVDFVHQPLTISLLSEEKPDIKRLIVRQPQDVDTNQTVLPADIQQVLLIKEEVPLERSPTLDQQHLHIKEELWIGLEGEQLNGQEEEADTTSFRLTDVPVKGEEDEKKPQLSELSTGSSAPQIKTESEGEDCGGAEPDRKPDPNSHLHTEEKASDSSETEVSEGEDVDYNNWRDARPKTKDGDNIWKKTRISECETFTQQDNLKTHKSAQKVLPADIQQVLVIKEEVPWSPSPDQQGPEPLHIKEEPEQLWTSQEEADIASFTASMKSEDYKEPATTSSAKEIKTEPDGEDCVGPEPARNPELSSQLQPNSDGNDSDTAETEVSIDDDDECNDDIDIEEGIDDDNEDSESNEDDDHDDDGGGAGDDDDCDGCDNEDSDCKGTSPGPEGSDGAWRKTRKSDFGSDDHVERVTQRAKEVKPFGCDVCSKRFTRQGNLKTHMKVHTGEKPFACEACGKRFILQSYLKSHVKVHTGDKPFDCDVCGKVFTRQGGLKSHMTIHTGEKPFGCDVCGKKLKRPADLKRHMKIHTGEKPFNCDVCGRKFARRTDVKSHMRVHIGEKTLSCDFCGKKFMHRSNLRSHIRLHTGEKPLECTVCGKRFRNQSNFKRHMKIHTGEKPFVCGVCGERFSRGTHVLSHMTVHTGEKPFYCDMCGERFTRHGNLKRHIRQHMLDGV